MMNKIDISRLRELLRFDADTGRIYRKTAVPKGRTSEAGSVYSNGYIRLRVDGVNLAAHRVAWALHTGEWPPDELQIDHINGVKVDNRPSNLRLANNSENQSSAKSRPGKSGLRGVDWYAQTGRWRAKIMKGKKTIHLGYFDDKHDAHDAYCRAAAEIHGEFHNTQSRDNIREQ